MDLEEENHRLLNKLNLLEEMEIVYRGEIETLKETITNLEQKKSRASQNIDCQSANSLEISRKKNQLTEELEAARNSETELLEQLEVYHKKLNKICRNPSIPTLTEVELLENELSEMRVTEQQDIPPLYRRVEELGQDFLDLQSYANELKEMLKERHSELEDAEAQYEALQNQPSSTQTTSLFDEVNKERILVERTVAQLSKEIKELRGLMKKTHEDFINSVQEASATMYGRYSERQKDLKDIIRRDFEHIRWANKTATRRMQIFKDIQKKIRYLIICPENIVPRPSCRRKVEACFERYCEVIQRYETDFSRDAEFIMQISLEPNYLKNELKRELRFQEEENSNLSTHFTELKGKLDALNKLEVKASGD
uniref:Uncharacterized protein n=1 Tax=Trichobilharzia regenti TaxID=157069 RepID=A0AA85K0K3_TRIRE|nr:unnamed protein product [Trichobilharzia regenti]